jgi:uncharacterized protein (TIGR00255 family)
MTGFGSGEAPLGRGRLVVDVRAVNHRFLDVRVRLPSELGDEAFVAEEVARRALDRGRIELGGRIEGPAGREPRLDVPRARAAFQQLGALRDELRPDEAVPLSLLAIVPDLFSTEAGPPAEQARAAVRTATEVACASLSEMRAREGERLAADLRARLVRVREVAEQLGPRVGEVVEAYRKKLRERIERLLAGTPIELDAGRLEHEVALFADRADISEELTRLVSHCEQFGALIESDERAVGRKLDFLLQEMNRETNTIGSKSSDVSTVRTVVDTKAELERMREQVQNVL